MSIRSDLLKARFHLNMGRINGLVTLIFTDPLRPKGLFQSDGVRADILRAIVVFLHATFEDILRSHLPKQNRKLTISSGAMLAKALTLSGIDAKPSKRLFPPLIQMAKRRHRIMHNADLKNRTDTGSEIWGVVDEWQLIMWLLAVMAFYYQLRTAVNGGSVAESMVESTMNERLRKAMLSWVDFGSHLLALPELPPELHREALEKAVVILRTIAVTLKLDVNDFIVNEG